MSTSSPLNAIAAILPASLTVQDIAIRLAGGVCEAYAAYNNGSNLAPSLDGYGSINTISAWEEDPNIDPFSAAETALTPQGASSTSAADGPQRPQGPSPTNKKVTVPRVPAAYAGLAGAPSNACTGPTPAGTPKKGYQLFGFTAASNDNSHNILILRGTVTMEEAAYDLLGWGTNGQCNLPSQAWPWDQKTYGMVNSDLYSFYTGADLDSVTSLAKSCLDAIKATAAANPNASAPWFIGAHSLGGAIASLAALDAVVSGTLSSNNTLVITYGSLHVGDQSFADAYTPQVPFSLRVANLCDFVPSMVSLEPVTPTDPYVHVGWPGTFTWQTWDDWGNHSLANIYQPIVQSYWNLIQWGPQTYPQ
jgi:Lipase (class 3)